jgi:hypothetical protein
MHHGLYWKVDDHKALTAGVRAYLLSTFGYTAPGTDTYGAIVSIMENGLSIETFPFTFVLATYQTNGTGNLEAAIDAACRARLLALRNASPLTSIVDRVHPL